MSATFPPLYYVFEYCVIAEYYKVRYHDFKSIHNWRTFTSSIINTAQTPENFYKIFNDRVETLDETQLSQYRRYVINDQNLGENFHRNIPDQKSIFSTIQNWTN